VKQCINGRVVVLQLEGLRLQGAAPDLALLAPLQGLRSLSLSNNNLTGAFPDVSALPALRFFFLYQNRLAGEIPDDAFAALRGLRKLNLAGNAFSGPIPSSIASSGHLLSVDLSNNNFSGPIPEGLRKLGANVQLQGELVRHGFPVVDMEFLFDACNGYVFSVSCLANFAIFLWSNLEEFSVGVLLMGCAISTSVLGFIYLVVCNFFLINRREGRESPPG
jgi:hypothetical protein